MAPSTRNSAKDRVFSSSSSSCAHLASVPVSKTGKSKKQKTTNKLIAPIAQPLSSQELALLSELEKRKRLTATVAQSQKDHGTSSSSIRLSNDHAVIHLEIRKRNAAMMDDETASEHQSEVESSVAPSSKLGQKKRKTHQVVSENSEDEPDEESVALKDKGLARPATTLQLDHEEAALEYLLAANDNSESQVEKNSDAHLAHSYDEAMATQKQKDDELDEDRDEDGSGQETDILQDNGVRLLFFPVGFQFNKF
jgi:hypothetical protein